MSTGIPPTFGTWIFLLCIALPSVPLKASGTPSAQDRQYGFVYFEDGYPTRLKAYRRPEAMANRAARLNPDVVIQTGFYSLRLEGDTLRLSGYDALEGEPYLEALNTDVQDFSPARLLLRFQKDGITYTATAGIVQEEKDCYIRLIESGRYVQRFDHTGLVFTAKNGAILKPCGRLEITAWPEHAVFTLDLSDVEGVEYSGLELTSPNGRVFRAGGKDTATLVVRPHLDREYRPADSDRIIQNALSLQNGQPLKVDFDPQEFGVRIHLPLNRVKFPEDTGRLDEFTFELYNPTEVDCSIPLIFNETESRAITGTSMLLCEADGRPTGIPVQISKNWHRKLNHPTPHEGPWLRGYTVVTLKPGERRSLRLRVITGFWEGVPSVSYAQLSVIGYGGNWKWDESALGCWGESMCYDPAQHLGAAFITDVRPSFTTGINNGQFEWTENVGGGDFLIYMDSGGRYRWCKRLKTAYHWTGPNMSEVWYSGVTDDEAIRFNYRVRSVRTADYHRRFHAYSYTFLKDVPDPERLVFYQMAADYYNTVDFEQFYTGHADGLAFSGNRHEALNGYAEKTIDFAQAWLAIDDTICDDGKETQAKARRGLINMSSTLNGKPFPLKLHRYGLQRNRHRINFDFGSPSISRSFNAGDRVDGEFEFILPAKSPDVYWGSDAAFAQRLKTYGTNAWQAVFDEYRHNVRMQLAMHSGTRTSRYPVEILAAKSGPVLADFTITRGGIGHIPILLKNVPTGRKITVEQWTEGKWEPVAGINPRRQTGYQAYLNDKGSMDCAFNLLRPDGNPTGAWRIRIRVETVPEPHENR